MTVKRVKIEVVIDLYEHDVDADFVETEDITVHYRNGEVTLLSTNPAGGLEIVWWSSE